MHTGDHAEVGYQSDASGQWLLQDGFASGTQSGSTSLSYNGSGSYSNGITGVGIIFAYPPSSGPNNGPGGDGLGGEGEGGGSSSESGSSWIAVSGSVSITGSLTGSAYASGTLTGSLWSSWNDSLDGSANLSYAGSGSQSTTLSAVAGYLGTGSFSASGAVSGTGTYTESGSSLYNETHDYDYNLNASGTWELDGSSSAATYSGWTSSWASGSGATLVNGSSVIASVLPDVTTTSFSGSATPGAGQSEVPTWLYNNVQRGERLQEQVPVLAEEGGSQQDLYLTAAKGGSQGGSSNDDPLYRGWTSFFFAGWGEAWASNAALDQQIAENRARILAKEAKRNQPPTPTPPPPSRTAVTSVSYQVSDPRAITSRRCIRRQWPRTGGIARPRHCFRVASQFQQPHDR